jgi:hypothetical protein
VGILSFLYYFSQCSMSKLVVSFINLMFNISGFPLVSDCLLFM